MKLVGNVHLIQGTAEDMSLVYDLLREAGIKTSGNSDLYVRTYRQFGVDDARELSDRAALRAALGSRRVFVIAMDSITAEAQNALLKTLEEQSGEALFIFIHPVPQTLLATVRSRAQMLVLSPKSRTVLDGATQRFLKAAPQERLEMLKPLLEKGEDDRRDMGAMLAFLASLERTLTGRITAAGARETLEAIYRARKYIGDRGALVKPLLEQVALLI